MRPTSSVSWVLRDVVFQDVGFETNSCIPLTVTHLSFRCEVPTPSIVEGQSPISIKPHILKRHIPELPTDRLEEGPAGREHPSIYLYIYIYI